MSLQTTVKVQGLEEALRELRKIEPEYVKDFRKRARGYAADAVQSAKKEFDHTKIGWRSPDAPLTNMDKGSLVTARGAGFKWNARKARAGIKFKIGGPTRRKSARARSYRMFQIIEADGPGALYDMAGKKRSNPAKNFEETLDEYADVPHQREQPGYPRTGPSRFMWPGVSFYLPTLEHNLVNLVHDLEMRTGRKLMRRPRR